jgi:hypothetical protein
MILVIPRPRLPRSKGRATMSWLLASAVVAVVFGWPGVDPVALRSAAPARQSVNSPIDLVQIQLTVPSKVTVGKLFRVMDEVENQGTSLAWPTTTYFYLSEDDVLDARDVLVGGRRVPRLGANQSHSTSTPVTLKPGIAAGNYYLIALADGGRQLEERYRENNTRAVRLTVLRAEEPKKK